MHMGIICALAAVVMIGTSSVRLLAAARTDVSLLATDEFRGDSNLLIMGTIACLLWAVYGVLVRDLFVSLLNFAGFFIGAAQLLVVTLAKLSDAVDTDVLSRDVPGPAVVQIV